MKQKIGFFLFSQLIAMISSVVIDSKQKQVYNKKSPAPFQWHLAKMGVPEFWQAHPLRTSVWVLICDAGVDSRHPNLKNHVESWMEAPMPSSRETGTEPGLLVSSLRMAEHKDTAKCIRWGVSQGIRIVNLSYSGSIDNKEVQLAAEELARSGGVLVVSAGNRGEKRDYPEAHNMIVVGSTDYIDWKPPWANTGDYVDIVAPGASLDTLDQNQGFMNGRGTSLSAAVTSGVLALLLSVDPNQTTEDLKAKLFESTQDLGAPGRDPAFGRGRIDLHLRK